MITYIVLGIVILSISLMVFASEYLSHIGMNKEEGVPYKYCHFKEFLEEYKTHVENNDITIEYNQHYKSIFVYKANSYFQYIVYLHANIIKFDNNLCMILYPLSYIRYCIWKHNLFKQHKGDNNEEMAEEYNNI